MNQMSDYFVLGSGIRKEKDDRMFTPGHSKGRRFDFTSSRLDKMVSCIVKDSRFESEYINCFSLPPSQHVWNLYKKIKSTSPPFCMTFFQPTFSASLR